MKASSVALEVEVGISREELIKLDGQTLPGVLKFNDWFSQPNIKRDIPIEIKYNSQQNEFLEVQQNPRGVYFGEANSIRFIINREYYQSLISNGLSIGRFWHSGKLRVKIDGYEEPPQYL